MQELIPVKVKNDRQLVSARDLHKALEAKRQFTNWWKQDSKGFIKGADYEDILVSIPYNKLYPDKTQKVKDYLLTIDTAKEICMLSKTEKGKAIRKYFIQVEKEWNNPDMVMKRALSIADSRVKELQSKNEALTLQLEESTKKASYLDVILGTPDALAITQIAADYGYSPQAFNKLLHRVGIQHKVNGQWILYKVYMAKGYVTTKNFSFYDHRGIARSKPSTYWTQKGRKLIYDILKDEGILPLIERKDIA